MSYDYLGTYYLAPVKASNDRQKKDRRNLIRRPLIRYPNESRVFVNIGLDVIFLFFVLVCQASGGGGPYLAVRKPTMFYAANLTP